MASSSSNAVQAVQHLEQIVANLGIAHVVYLLADIAEQQSALLQKQDSVKAARFAHDAKVLSQTAITLLS